ncbi:MAG: nucleotide sugar epimerase [Gammaproteobacteria bacterium]|jgi:nucleoside-diphosphate-sugar epimerase|nr:nucleotide sugar epimerase [Gammaproteobacteria bacterium]HJP19081.1 NAD-dependent epimerase/dehydratase family protein [Nitrospinota bacterium]|tara:strand:- start:3236 stop:4189 length:954 start_codon:yes stop_codon:yes gene_type:complete
MKNILVTGGAGAIGSRLVEKLSQSENRIIVLDNLSSGFVENVTKSDNVQFVQGDIESEDVLKTVFFNKIDTVFHLAANFANQNSVDFPEKDLMVNGLGTLKLLEYSVENKISKFVYSSSSCVYGQKNEPLSEEMTDYSLDTPYAITKLLGERYVTYFNDHYGLSTVILRYFNSYGPAEYPGKYRNVIPNFFYKAMRGEALVITGTGQETRDFNYIDDTVSGTLAASGSQKAVGKIFNIGSGRETKIIDIANIVNRITKNKSEIKFVEKRKWDNITSRVASIEKAQKLIDYSAQVKLEEGLKKTYEWLRQVDFNKCAF